MKFVIYRGKNREWYWKIVARNGRTRGDGSEGYKRQRDCMKGVLAIRSGLRIYRRERHGFRFKLVLVLGERGLSGSA